MTPFHKLAVSLFVVAILTCNKDFGQTRNMASQENKFVKLFSKLASFIQADYDSIGFYSARFEKEFTSFIKNNPASLNYPFKRLIDSNFCDIRTSSDGAFRIYNWDTWTGGTMHVFRTIYQWKGNSKIFVEVPKYEEGDPGSFCSKIFTVNINEKPLYLAITNGIFSTKDAMQSISVYRIESNKLVDTVKLFKTKTKKLSRIDVEFDFFSVVDRPERPLELLFITTSKR